MGNPTSLMSLSPIEEQLIKSYRLLDIQEKDAVDSVVECLEIQASKRTRNGQISSKRKKGEMLDEEIFRAVTTLLEKDDMTDTLEFVREAVAFTDFLAECFISDLFDGPHSNGYDESEKAADYVTRVFGYEPPELLKEKYPELDLDRFFHWLGSR